MSAKNHVITWEVTLPHMMGSVRLTAKIYALAKQGEGVCGPRYKRPVAAGFWLDGMQSSG